jgi:hypothetical protein
LLPVFKSALLRNATATSFKHALYWLMRNLFKIPRGAAGVNVGGILAGIWCVGTPPARVSRLNL